ncbi:MAG: immunity 49 family protein [Acidobacteria bacterium]|nr:immunity 49 family protein [Acidobacteriota bacterium]
MTPDPRDPALWTGIAGSLKAAAELRAVVLAAGRDDDAAFLLAHDASTAALASLDPARKDLTASLLQEAAACGVAAVVCAARAFGTVSLECPGGVRRAFPAGGGAGMNGPRWALAAALASIAGEAASFGVLCHPSNVLAIQEPPEAADAFWAPYTIALAAFYSGDPATGELIEHALDALAERYLKIADPQFVRDTRAPILRLLLASAQRDPEAGQALSAALDAHSEYYGAGPGKGDRTGLLAFEIGGICAAAGLDMDHPLLAPLRAARQAPPCKILYRFPRQPIVDDLEAHWFLDSQGFPRAGRTHEIVDNQGVLEARYRASGAPGLPPSEAAFALSDNPAPSARDQALGIIEILRAQVQPLLESLSHDRTGRALQSVRPRPEDYAKAFLGEAAEAARRHYAAIWTADESQLPPMRYADPAQTIIRSDIAPAGMLAEDNELSRQFPGGYRAIAPKLDPHRVWVRWKCLRPGESAGMAYDGLVWLDDHWAWFPKPYRALGQS